MSISPKQITADAIAEAKKVGSTITAQLRKLSADLESDNIRLLEKKSELEHRLTLQESRKVQSEHDRTQAVKAKVAEDKTGISIIQNTIGTADVAEMAMLSILNAKQVAKGLEPFKNYQSYLGVCPADQSTPIQEDNCIVPSTKNDPLTPLDKIVAASYDYNGRPLLAAGDVYHIVAGGYYIGWNRSRCYVQNPNTNEINILVSGDRLYGDACTMAIIPNKSFRDLTRAEFEGIVNAKPAYNKLFRVFSKTQNFQNVQLNIKAAVPVW
jgi:hypothetical protein